MSESLSSLFNYKKINRLFKDALKIDIYDDHTMINFVKKNTGELSISELEIMMNTVVEEIEHGKTLQSFFTSLFSVIIAILSMIVAAYISCYVLITSILIDAQVVGAIDYLQKFLRVISAVGFIYMVLLGYYFFWKNRNSKIRNKLYETIKITIHIKNNSI
ncbi:hypothetical protein M3649_21120 [Ureibacillus chungkukjangi]|uniref:hypothetical protein n=1 Tax=Ureibacillus chungkukjangi TaxID=1202712 RepID=UPI00203BF1A2|nr:hypothetical protein [Ureibacillus chungkukjangi]MCM3390588.1 hypothetical protein [Ureibacillus chungkukjangi]